jgi:hypothetical protein
VIFFGGEFFFQNFGEFWEKNWGFSFFQQKITTFAK